MVLSESWREVQVTLARASILNIYGGGVAAGFAITIGYALADREDLEKISTDFGRLRDSPSLLIRLGDTPAKFKKLAWRGDCGRPGYFT